MTAVTPDIRKPNQLARTLRRIVKTMIVGAALSGLLSAGRAQRLIARLGLRSA